MLNRHTEVQGLFSSTATCIHICYSLLFIYEGNIVICVSMRYREGLVATPRTTCMPLCALPNS